MTTAAAERSPRQAGPKVWQGWIPLSRHDVRLNPKLATAGLEVRYLLTVLDSLKGSRGYISVSNEYVAVLLFGDSEPKHIRKLQRLLADAEDLALIHRETITGRVDKVSGRETVTGRIGIIPLVSFSGYPVPTTQAQLDQAIDAMHKDLARKSEPLRFPPQVHDTVARHSCTSDLSSPLNGREEGLEERDDEIRAREAAPVAPPDVPKPSSSSPAKREGGREESEAEPVVIPFTAANPEELDQALLGALADRVATMLGAKDPGYREDIRFKLDAKARCKEGKNPREVLTWIERLVTQAERSKKTIPDFFAWLYVAIQKCGANGPAIVPDRKAPVMQNHNPAGRKEPVRKTPGQMNAAEREERRAELRRDLADAEQTLRDCPNRFSEQNRDGIVAELKALDAADKGGGAS